MPDAPRNAGSAILATLLLALGVALPPSRANAEPQGCGIGKVRFAGVAACALVQKIKAGEEVAFRPITVMGLITEICEALNGRMDERLKADFRKTHFRTSDGFDCYRSGEPIWIPPAAGRVFRPPPLIIRQSARQNQG